MWSDYDIKEKNKYTKARDEDLVAMMYTLNYFPLKIKHVDKESTQETARRHMIIFVRKIISWYLSNGHEITDHEWKRDMDRYRFTGNFYLKKSKKEEKKKDHEHNDNPDNDNDGDDADDSDSNQNSDDRNNEKNKSLSK